MSQEFSVVGKRLPRPDAWEKATGAARYTVDLKLPGMLVGKVLRSPYPHAKVLKIDKSEAERLPDVEAVITMEDVPRIPYSVSFRDMPEVRGGVSQHPDQYIFDDKVRYVGDAVAAVAATNKEIAEKALELIRVEYAKLPAVFDPVEAMKPRAPRIHDYAEGNIAVHISYPHSTGDVEKAFQDADYMVGDTFHTTKQIHCHLEPEAAIASFDAAGRLTVWSPCQLAHLARRELAHIFGMPVGMVRIINPHVGGSFGTRLDISAEPICIALAKKAGKPVKIEYTKEEDFGIMATATACRSNVKLGFKKDGTLAAIQMKAIAQAGGYLGRSPTVAALLLAEGLGHYRCSNTAGEVDVVYTNTVMSGAFRGFGNPPAMWGVEQVMDMAADKLGIDPVELRLKNIKKTGELGIGALPIQSSALEQCIRIGAKRIGWKEKRARKDGGVKRRGVGMAITVHSSGGYPFLIEHSNAFIKLNEDGSASLVVHPGEPGTGIWGVLSQIAAEELGLHAEDIHIVTGDTDVTMFDIGSKASRSTYIIGNAVLKAAREAKGQLLERTAKLLGVSAAELEVKDRQVYVRTTPSKRISVAEVAFDAIYNSEGECLNISGKCSFEPTTYSPTTQAVFAEVEVDTEIGEVKVLKVVIANDSGTAINPLSVEGQIEGGLSQGLGYTLREDPIIDTITGEVMTSNFETYRIPSTLDMPEVEMILVQEPDPAGPFGAKGVGEISASAIAPAISNAIYYAVGVRITKLPVTPEKILKALGKHK